MMTAQGRLTKALGHLHDAKDAIDSIGLAVESKQMALGEENESKRLNNVEDSLLVVTRAIAEAQQTVRYLLDPPATWHKELNGHFK